LAFIQEGKAEKALEAVSAMLASRATVLREGERHEIDASLLVPGDIVFLESGARVPADLRLLRVKNLRINEAALTGESVPAEKRTQAVANEAAIGDRLCLAYSGTVVSFGQATRRRRRHRSDHRNRTYRAARRRRTQTLATPLTRRLDQFARQITLIHPGRRTDHFPVRPFLFTRDDHVLEVFLAVVGLAVAAIPEGLPAIVTIVLAIGTRVMARQNAIVRRLPAVETLGSVTVICSDKTGTLTRERDDHRARHAAH
jgi:magnesium-transporting ATPase (P-type)